MPDKDEFGLDEEFEFDQVEPTAIVVYDAPMDAADSYDLESARQNIHHLLQKGNVALDELIMIARKGESIAGFEQVTKMIKALSDINKDLITVQEKKKILKIQDDKKSTVNETSVINNNLYVGTTEDFAKVMEELDRKK